MALHHCAQLCDVSKLSVYEICKVAVTYACVIPESIITRKRRFHLASSPLQFVRVIVAGTRTQLSRSIWRTRMTSISLNTSNIVDIEGFVPCEEVDVRLFLTQRGAHTNALHANRASKAMRPIWWAPELWCAKWVFCELISLFIVSSSDHRTTFQTWSEPLRAATKWGHVDL